MTDKLPPNLLALFAPRPPLRFIPPADHAPEERQTANISGLSAFIPQLQEYKATDVYEPTESWLQRKDRLKLEKKQHQEQLSKEGPVSCEGDPTCFDYLLSTLVRLLALCIIFVTFTNTRLLHRQASRGPEHPRRRFQNSHCSTAKL